MANKINYSKRVIRQSISSRGGGIEIELNTLGFKGAKMTAYQNYLGGGMLGSIQNDCTINNWRENEKLVRIAEGLAKYFHSLTNPDDEWEGMSFENRQAMPASAY